MMMTVLSPDDALHIDAETFIQQARKQFGADVQVHTNAHDRPYDLTIELKDAVGRIFHIFHDRLGETIATDGPDEMVAEVATWIRSLLPDDPGGRVWLVDEGLSGHVELVQGITGEMIRQGWVDHSDNPAGSSGS